MDNDQLIQQWELEVKGMSDKFTCHPSQQRWSTDERWERLEMLGRGGYGEVWLQKCTTGPRVGDLRAVKEISKDFGQSSEHENIKIRDQELSALIKFSHQRYRDHFVSSFGWFQTTRSLFITMQYFPHGDLQSHIAQPLSDGQASAITRQILQGLSFMHQSKFAHRDLKPANILVQEKGPNWWVKLSDFGCSKEATTLRTTVGTPPYWAPELCNIFTHADEESSDCIADRTYSFEVDIWAVGVIAFRSTTGALPFGGGPYSKLYRYVRQGAPFPTSLLLTGESKLFIEWLMSRSPGDRPTATQALAHSWVSSSHHDRSASSTTDEKSSGPRTSGPSGNRQASGRWTTATPQSPSPKKVQPSDTDTTSGAQSMRLPSEGQRSANYSSTDLASTTGAKDHSSDLDHFDHPKVGFWRRSLSFINHLRKPADETANNQLTPEESPGLSVIQDHNYIIYSSTQNTQGDSTHTTEPQAAPPPNEARPIITTRVETAIAVTIDADNSPVQPAEFCYLGPVTCLAFSPDGKWFASIHGREYGTRLQLWSIDEQGLFRKSHCLKTAHSRLPTSISFSSDSNRLVLFFGQDWSGQTNEQLIAVACTLGGRGYFEPVMSHYVSNSNTIRRDKIAKDGRRIIIAWVEPKSEKQRITIWDANSQEVYEIFQEHYDANRGLFWSEDGEQYAGVRFRRANGNHFFKSQAPGGMLVRHTLPPAYQLAAVAGFSSDCRWFAAQSFFGSGFVVFEIMPGGSWRLSSSLGAPSTVRAVAFSPDSRTLVASCKTNRLVVWDLNDSGTFKLRRQYIRNAVTKLAFSPDGKLLALGDSDGISGMIEF